MYTMNRLMEEVEQVGGEPKNLISDENHAVLASTLDGEKIINTLHFHFLNKI